MYFSNALVVYGENYADAYFLRYCGGVRKNDDMRRRGKEISIMIDIRLRMFKIVGVSASVSASVSSPVSSQFSSSSELALILSSPKLSDCKSGTLAKAHSFKISLLSLSAQVLPRASSLKSVIIDDRR